MYPGSASFDLLPFGPVEGDPLGSVGRGESLSGGGFGLEGARQFDLLLRQPTRLKQIDGFYTLH